MVDIDLRAPAWRGLTTRCGELMPMYGEPCWRRPGHTLPHRSQSAIQNQNEAHRRSHRLEYVPEVRR